MNRSSSIDNAPLRGGDRVAYGLATGLGAGFTPVAPGTVGALEGIAVYLAVYALRLEQASTLLILTILNFIVFAVGVWASNRTCEVTRLKDPHLIVIDEVSGQLISLTPLALLPSLSVIGLVIGFLLFRLFDIFKPYPIRRLERLPGGFGVMADDALAGIYAASLVWLCVNLRLI